METEREERPGNKRKAQGENGMSYLERLKLVIDLVRSEYMRATVKFGKFHNAHEGYAVLLEEVDELWDSVKLNQRIPRRDTEIMHEAIQVAAMAIRIIVDCGGDLE